MKRRLMTVLILLFASFIMVGCDFGRNDDTTAAPVTTQTPTTQPPTTQPPTTQTTTTDPGEMYHTVTFYDGDGSVLATQTVIEGGSASSPGTPTKAATAQYTYTFDEWAQDFSNVLANMNIYPVFTETLNVFEVTFYNGDGSVLETQNVNYGSNASTPTTIPVKTADGADAFEFDSWSISFNNVTGDLMVNPIFTTVFNRMALLRMIETMFIGEPGFGEIPEDPEDVLLDLEEMTGVSSDEDMYYMLVDMWDLYQELFSIRTGTELQAWYSATKAAGFDKDFFIDTLYNAMNSGISNDFNHFTENVADYTQTVADYTASVANAQAAVLALNSEAASYCTLGVNPLLSLDCESYWDSLNYTFELESVYRHQLEQMTSESYIFDWNVYMNMISTQEQLIYQTVINENQNDIDYYQDMLDDMIDDLSYDEYNLYYPLINTYAAYKTLEYELAHSDQYTNLQVPDLSGTQDIKANLDNLYYGNMEDFTDDDYHYSGLQYYLFELEYLEEELMYAIEYLGNEQDNLDNIVVIYGFISNAANEQMIKELMETVYDMLDAVVLTVDDQTIDFIVEFAMGMMLQSVSFDENQTNFYGYNYYNDYYIDFYDEGYNDGMDIDFLAFMTPENIEWFASKFNTTLVAAFSTLDQADFDNAKLVLFGFLEAQMLAEGIDALVIADTIAAYELMYDKYTGYFQTIGLEITSLLGSIDTAKATAISELFNQDFGMMTDIDIAILVSQGIEILMSDDSFDLSLILQIVAEVYFETSEDYNPTPAELAVIQSDIDTYIIDTLALMYDIADYDPHMLTVAEVENIMEVMQRVMLMPTWLSDGFSSVSDPIEFYEGSMFDSFINEFMGDLIDPADAMILYQSIFGVVDEDETYYTLRAVQQYLLGLTTIRGFDDLQVWMAGLESFGFTQAEMIAYLMEYAAWYSSEFVDGTPEFQNQIMWIQSQIDYWTLEYDDSMDMLDAYDFDVQEYIYMFDVMYQTTASDYWMAMKDGVVLNRVTNDYEQELRMYIDGYLVDDLQYMLDMILFYTYDTPNPSALAATESDYVIFLANYSDDTDIQGLIIGYRTNYITNEMYYENVLDPLLDLLDGALYENYIAFLNITNDNIDNFDEVLGELEWFEDEIIRYEENLERTLEELEFIILINDLFNDPSNYTETEAVINLVLDDFQYMVDTMPAGSFELVEQIIEFVIMMDGYDGPMSVEDLPFATADIYAFTQDLSALLKLRNQTYDANDILVLEAYILTVVTEYVEDMGLAPMDELAEIARINGLALKYINFADDALDELTALLDDLSEADVQLVLNAISVMTENGHSVYEQVVTIAKAIDAVYDPSVVDLDVIVDMFLEVYFDMEYETYDSQDLSDTQVAWKLYIGDLETLIMTVAAYDINTMNPLNYATLMQLQQSVMYLGYMFENPMYILDNGPTSYMFDMMYLEEMLAEMFGEDEPTSIVDLADTFITILGITPGDYEALYYEIQGFASVIMNVDKIESPQDIFTVYQGIKSLGYTNAEIADIVSQGLMTFLYPQLGQMSDVSGWESEVLDLQSNIDGYLADIASINLSISNEINAIWDLDPMDIPAAQMAANDLWYANLDEVAAYVAYEQTINMYSTGMYNFDWYIWDQIENAYLNDEAWRIDEILYGVDAEVYDTYMDIYHQYQEFKYYQELKEEHFNEYMMYYSHLGTTFDDNYSLSQHMEDEASAIMYVYFNIADVENEIMYIQSNIDDTLAMAWIPMMFEDFLSDAANVTMLEDVLEEFLNQVDAWAMDPNIEVFDHILMFFNNGPAGLTTADLATEIQMIGSLLTHVLSEMDATDEALLLDFIVALSESYANVQYGPTEAAIMKVYFDTKINEILPDILDVPAILGSYLTTFDEVKTQALIESIVEVFLLCPKDPNGEIRQVINISGIIKTALYNGVGSDLDYEGLITPIIKLIYEMQTLTGNPPMAPVQDIIDELVDSLDTIFDYAVMVADYNPTNISDLQWDYLDEFYMSIEDLLEYLGMYFR